MSNRISNYFSGIGAKRLSEVEVNPKTSNQHEFNGIKEFKELFGDSKIKYQAKFLLLSDEEDKNFSANGNLTWYDARENHETRTEYRFYYTSNDVIKNASAGDLLIIGRTGSDTVAVIIAPADSTIEKQLLWLFNLSEVKDKFIVISYSNDSHELSYAEKYILSELGFDTAETDNNLLDIIFAKFGEEFPSTSDFSSFARTTLLDISPLDDPDYALISWMERETILFKTLERFHVEKKLKEGFGKSGIDVDNFISYSLSIQNRRKSRAGFAFENHLSEIFKIFNVRYSRGKTTELNKKPDFLFPGVNEYHNQGFDSQLLTMLGLKTSAKDRWRQVLSEATRINTKHLMTLEPSISKNQTDEMISEKVQLVIPKEIHKTFLQSQQDKILTLSQFIEIVLDRQRKAFN